MTGHDDILQYLNRSRSPLMTQQALNAHNESEYASQSSAVDDSNPQAVWLTKFIIIVNLIYVSYLSFHTDSEFSRFWLGTVKVNSGNPTILPMNFIDRTVTVGRIFHSTDNVSHIQHNIPIIAYYEGKKFWNSNNIWMLNFENFNWILVIQDHN